MAEKGQAQGIGASKTTENAKPSTNTTPVKKTPHVVTALYGGDGVEPALKSPDPIVYKPLKSKPDFKSSDEAKLYYGGSWFDETGS